MLSRGTRSKAFHWSAEIQVQAYGSSGEHSFPWRKPQEAASFRWDWGYSHPILKEAGGQGNRSLRNAAP